MATIPDYSYVTVYFPSQISSVSSGRFTVTESGNQLSVARNDGENAGVITCMIENGYKISNAVWAGADEYNNLSVTFENNVITLHDDGQGSKSGSLTITVEQSNPKSVSDSNLARFKDKCDETYAPMSRALPAPAGTTDTGKVPTVNSAGNGYELQTPSGGGGTQLYKHSVVLNSTTYGNINITIIGRTNQQITTIEEISDIYAGNNADLWVASKIVFVLRESKQNYCFLGAINIEGIGGVQGLFTAVSDSGGTGTIYFYGTSFVSDSVSEI